MIDRESQLTDDIRTVAMAQAHEWIDENPFAPVEDFYTFMSSDDVTFPMDMRTANALILSDNGNYLVDARKRAEAQLAEQRAADELAKLSDADIERASQQYVAPAIVLDFDQKIQAVRRAYYGAWADNPVNPETGEPVEREFNLQIAAELGGRLGLKSDQVARTIAVTKDQVLHRGHYENG